MRTIWAAVAAILLAAGCVPRARTGASAGPPPPVPKLQPKPMRTQGAAIGYVVAHYKGDRWIFPPPEEGETLGAVHTALKIWVGAPMVAGTMLAGPMRVLEVVEYSRNELPGGDVTMIYQVAYTTEGAGSFVDVAPGAQPLGPGLTRTASSGP